MGGSASILSKQNTGDLSPKRQSSKDLNLCSTKATVNIQDEARSFKSKIGAIRLLLRNETSREGFLSLLEKEGKKEYAEYFYLTQNLRKEVMNIGKSALLDSLVLYQPCGSVMFRNTIDMRKVLNISIKEILLPLQTISYDESASQRSWLKVISLVEDNLLSQLFVEFGMFVETEEFQSSKSGRFVENSFSFSALDPQLTDMDAALPFDMTSLRQASIPNFAPSLATGH